MVHRQYEALRAYIAEGRAAEDVGRAFGYSEGSLRVLSHQFRHDEEFRRRFFPELRPETKSDRLTEKVVAMRKKNYSVYDIRQVLGEEGIEVSINLVNTILQNEGFEKLPRRLDHERPEFIGPEAAAVADCRRLDLSDRTFETRSAGLFLFVPLMTRIDLPTLCRQAGLPGSKSITAENALRTLLAMKLLGVKRKSHVMDYVFDQGIALFAGLNAVPKRSYLASYSSTIDRRKNVLFMKAAFEAMTAAGLTIGRSIDVDFHAVPCYSEDEIVERHYLPRRSRAQTAVLVFFAQDDAGRVFCYANADLRMQDRPDEVLQFSDYWKARTGSWPAELVFDSALTTHGNLSELNRRGIQFITLRRRSRKLLEELESQPETAWRRIELERVSREYRHPRIIDQQIALKGYEGPIRQIAVADLGHEEPTIVLTNQLRRSPAKIIDRYAHRMLIENGISEQIEFFHVDSLSSIVGLKVDFDLQITLMASGLYRLLGRAVGRGFERARAAHMFRKLVDVPGDVTISEDTITVTIAKRAYNPVLVAAGLGDGRVRMPWLMDRELVLQFR